MSEREDFYDSEIAPALLDLGKKCESSGLSFLAVVEWDPGETGQTATLTVDASFSMRLSDTATRAKGNVDALIIAMMKHAREHGHSSIFLKQLGVPLQPGEAI